MLRVISVVLLTPVWTSEWNNAWDKVFHDIIIRNIF